MGGKASPMTAMAIRSSQSWYGFGALLLVGGALDFIVRAYPANLPVWMPWEFNWPEYLAVTLSLAWFWRGLQLLPRSEHPPLWRKACFIAGVLSFYIVLQTHIDYYA